MSKIAIIGHGNVGFHLGEVLSNNHRISIFSRRPDEKHINELDSFRPGGFDFVFLTVPDDSIQELSNSIEPSESIILHTSGSRPLSDLDKHKRSGVFYPLQTFSRDQRIAFDAMPIFVEGTAETESKILSLAQEISSKVSVINSVNRSKIHLAAVFACNFTNHMYLIADQILADIDIEFESIRPLVEETLEKAFVLGPKNAQTGPAVRNDVKTLANHEKLLERDMIKELYRLVTKSIQKHQ